MIGSKRNVYKHMKRKIIVTVVLFMLSIAWIVLQFEMTLFDKVVSHGEPVAKIHREYITIGGSVEVDSIYVTRAKSKVVGRELQVTLKGFIIPLSRIEGEYNFEIKVNMNDYDSIVLVGEGPNQRRKIYSK